MLRKAISEKSADCRLRWIGIHWLHPICTINNCALKVWGPVITPQNTLYIKEGLLEMGLIDLFFFIHEYSNLFINIILVQSFPFFNFQSFRLKNFIFPTKITFFLRHRSRCIWLRAECKSYRYWDTGPRECSDIKTLKNFVLIGTERKLYFERSNEFRSFNFESWKLILSRSLKRAFCLKSVFNKFWQFVLRLAPSQFNFS